MVSIGIGIARFPFRGGIISDVGWRKVKKSDDVSFVQLKKKKKRTADRPSISSMRSIQPEKTNGTTASEMKSVHIPMYKALKRCWTRLIAYDCDTRESPCEWEETEQFLVQACTHDHSTDPNLPLRYYVQDLICILSRSWPTVKICAGSDLYII